MLSFSSLLSDARNFISNNLAVILIVVMSLSVISQLIHQGFYPDIETIKPIKSLLDQTAQQYGELTSQTVTQTIDKLPKQALERLVTAAMNYIMVAGLTFLITHLITITALLALIYTISCGAFSLPTLLQHSIKFTPSILRFMLLAIPGFIILSIMASLLAPLAMLLGMLGALCYLSVYMVYLAVIIEPTPSSRFIAKLKITYDFIKREKRLVLPMLAVWFLITFLLKTLVEALIAERPIGEFTAGSFIIEVAFDSLKLLLTLITICYFYRLYLLSNSNEVNYKN